MASGYTSVTDQDNSSVLMEISEQPYETQCWGCGLNLILPYLSPAFKCGWCGAVGFSKPRPVKSRKWIKCAVFRDHFLVGLVFFLILSITGGGLWTIYPVLFPSPSFLGGLQIFITVILLSITMLTYSFAVFVPPGSPAKLEYGSVDLVENSALNGYTFCVYCCCPKPPQAHHCRTCGTCIMDMDHHCPFIGTCVGANNHRHFLLFLVYTLISSSYVLLMSLLAGLRVWPPLLELYGGRRTSGLIEPAGIILAASFLDAFEEESEHSSLSLRSLGLIYLIITSSSILIGLTLLLKQQLQLLYEGQTYVESIQPGDDSVKSGWHNLRRLFGRRHPSLWLIPDFRRHSKLHRK